MMGVGFVVPNMKIVIVQLVLPFYRTFGRNRGRRRCNSFQLGSYPQPSRVSKHYTVFFLLPIIIVLTHSLSHLSNATILAAYLRLQSSQGDITSLANLASSTQSL